MNGILIEFVSRGSTAVINTVFYTSSMQTLVGRFRQRGRQAAASILSLPITPYKNEWVKPPLRPCSSAAFRRIPPRAAAVRRDAPILEKKLTSLLLAYL